MGIGISGLTSGMDTDSIVEALVATKTEKKNQLVKAQKKLELKQDAWKTLNSKIYSFYSKSLSNMRLVSSYGKKTTSVSNSTVATVVAKNSSVNGTQTLGVEQLAKSGYLTGGRVTSASGASVGMDTKLSDLVSSDNKNVTSGSINITVGGEDHVLTIDGDTTVRDFVSQLKNAGVNASFDTTNQRFFISSKESGKDNDFALTAAGGNGIQNLKALGLYTGATQADVTQYSTWASYDADKVNEIIEATYDKRKTSADVEKASFEKEIESLTKTNTSLTETNSKLTSEKAQLEYQRDYANYYKNGTNTQYYEDVKSALESYKSRVDGGETLSEADQKQYADLQVQMAAIEVVDKAIGDATANGEEEYTKYIEDTTKSIEEKEEAIKKNADTIAANEATIADKQSYVDDADKLQEYVDNKNADIHSSVEKEMNEKWESAKNYMVQYNYNKGDSTYKAEHQAEYEASVAAIGDISYSQTNDGTGAVRIEGQNSIIYLNDAKFESASNSFNVNGLSITAQELTGKNEDGTLKTVSITTSQDTQGVYNMVKDFLKEYNELINEMDKLYNAASAKGYEPLTDDEKADMTDKEIELWDEKVKGALLRRDSSLNNIIQVMKNSMAGGVTIDGKTSYLSEFGIQTGGYLYASENERGAYHINGDSDDELFSSKTDKLMAAITADPDHVAEVLSGIAGNLYQNMTTAMRSTSLSSTYTAYNDKQMKEEYNSYTEKIAAQEEKISWWEDYYRSKFTTMESMLATMNSQQSSLSGLLS